VSRATITIVTTANSGSVHASMPCAALQCGGSMYRRGRRVGQLIELTRLPETKGAGHVAGGFTRANQAALALLPIVHSSCEQWFVCPLVTRDKYWTYRANEVKASRATALARLDES
jgi:hypothetical protein